MVYFVFSNTHIPYDTMAEIGVISLALNVHYSGLYPTEPERVVGVYIWNKIYLNTFLSGLTLETAPELRSSRGF